MNPLPPEEYWQRFAAAARRGTEIAPPPPLSGPPPTGFVVRVVALAMQARREFLALLWERWSWRMALATAAIALTAGYFVMRHTNQPYLDVPADTLEVPPLETP